MSTSVGSMLSPRPLSAQCALRPLPRPLLWPLPHPLSWPPLRPQPDVPLPLPLIDELVEPGLLHNWLPEIMHSV